jgi:hypothetical protein
MKTFGGPLLDSEISTEFDALHRYQLSIVVGLQARAVLRQDPSDLGAMLAHLIAEAAGSYAQEHP